MTDTNQASEDELEHELDDIVHDALGEVFCPDCKHPRCLNKVKLYKAAIQALIRTEKLKLLAEVKSEWGKFGKGTNISDGEYAFLDIIEKLRSEL